MSRLEVLLILTCSRKLQANKPKLMPSQFVALEDLVHDILLMLCMLISGTDYDYVSGRGTVFFRLQNVVFFDAVYQEGHEHIW